MGGLLGEVLCRTTYIIQDVSTAVSIQSLVIIAVDRFRSIVFPLKPYFITTSIRAILLFFNVGCGIWIPHSLHLHMAIGFTKQPDFLHLWLGSTLQTGNCYQDVFPSIILLSVFYSHGYYDLSVLRHYRAIKTGPKHSHKLFQQFEEFMEQAKQKCPKHCNCGGRCFYLVLVAF